MTHTHSVPTQREHFTEYTILKVYDALRRAGLTEGGAREVIKDMQNNGILFRELCDVAKVMREYQLPLATDKSLHERIKRGQGDIIIGGPNQVPAPSIGQPSE